MVIIFYFINKTDEKGVGKDLVKESKDVVEKFANINTRMRQCS